MPEIMPEMAHGGDLRRADSSRSSILQAIEIK
jgi:hypothetical protein